jgi:predicted nucleic acid-binding protein
MILYLDTNVLVYRFASSAKLKAHAREWLDWHGRQPGSLWSRPD